MKKVSVVPEKTVTLSEMNEKPGQIIREVHFTKEERLVTDYGKPMVRLVPETKEAEPLQKEK